MVNYRKERKTQSSVTGALREYSKNKKILPDFLYHELLHDLFLISLRKLVEEKKIGGGWVLKGGANIVRTIGGARYTKDIDLINTNADEDIFKLVEGLVDNINNRKIGFYTLTVSRDRKKPRGGNTILKVGSCIDGGNFLNFKVDILAGSKKLDGLKTSTKTVYRGDGLNIEDIPSEYKIVSYSKENQLADKIFAIYQTYGDANNFSSRYRDLYDIAIIASQSPIVGISQGKAVMKFPDPISEESLRKALQMESKIRGVPMGELSGGMDVSNCAGWEERYENYFKKSQSSYFSHPCHGASKEAVSWVEDLRDFKTALLASKKMLDPILRGQASQNRFWDVKSMKWK